VKSGLLGAGLGVLAIALPSVASAQAPAPCAPDQTADVQITTKDPARTGRDRSLYATHEVELAARVQTDASDIRLTPEPGVTVFDRGSNGKHLDLVVPARPSVALTASWEQPASSNPGETARCAASRTLTLPVVQATPPALRLIDRGAPHAAQYVVAFEIKAARRGQAMEPIELTLRRTSQPRLPSRRAKALRWSIPMRAGERKRYARKIPAFTFGTSLANACRYWYLSCGHVLGRVMAMDVHRSPDRTLAFSQPSRWAAPFGIHVEVSPMGRSPRRFGFDIQARQGGRLLARYRRAGECRDAPGSLGGVVQDCTIVAVQNFPR
jgi:hypothetical protein